MSKRRVHIPRAKPGQLLVKWGRQDGYSKPDIIYAHGGSGAGSCDARLLCYFLEMVEYRGRNLRNELAERGYDLTTLRFSIQQKEPAAVEPSRTGEDRRANTKS